MWLIFFAGRTKRIFSGSLPETIPSCYLMPFGRYTLVSIVDETFGNQTQNRCKSSISFDR